MLGIKSLIKIFNLQSSTVFNKGQVRSYSRGHGYGYLAESRDDVVQHFVFLLIVVIHPDLVVFLFFISKLFNCMN